MKRIIYSIYTNQIDPHKSSTSYKKSQFEKWKSFIEANQKDYALLCRADYNLHTTNTTSYDDIQFEKILLLEEYAKHYDEILYLDFDVIAHTSVNYFEYHDMSKLTVHGLKREPTAKELKWAFKNGTGFDNENTSSR